MANVEKTIKALTEWREDPNALNAEIDGNLVSDAIDCLESLRAEIKQLKEQQQKWIPIDEQLPERGETVLFADKYETCFGYLAYNSDVFMGVDDCLKEDNRTINGNDEWGLKYLYWTPLPKPPKQDEEEE